MGVYLNPGNGAFCQAVKSEIYIDKTGLLEYTNHSLGTEQKYICVSRPRRFGKSMAARMLAAYYDKSCDSRELFENRAIGETGAFLTHLNQYHVIFLNMQKFLSRSDSLESMVEYLQEKVIEEIRDEYPTVVRGTERYLAEALEQVYASSGISFVIIIDEWDCIFREYRHDTAVQAKYLDFLRDLLKDAECICLAYMTGILPVKKYGTHSALNMFDEYSMTNPEVLAPYVGFTEAEVRELCEIYGLEFTEVQRWYDGYHFREIAHIYNPKSVVDAMRRGRLDCYWTHTETYEALRIYLEINLDGLKDGITNMLGGGRCRINPRRFQNDMTTFHSRDDVFTLLVHLGYLAYDWEGQTVLIPNLEIAKEFKDAIEGLGHWGDVAKLLVVSEELLKDTINRDAESVAKKLDQFHSEETSILSYNDENALSCVISLAYFSARKDYTLVREFPAGKGFSDIVFFPRKGSEKPAMVVELKWNRSAKAAIKQIKEKQYIQALKGYQGEVLLVGINYSRRTKKHQCVIEEAHLV